MDLRFKILIITLSSLLLSTNAVPSTFLLDIHPTNAPTAAPDATTASNNANIFLGSLMSVAAKATQISPQIVNLCKGGENPTLCAETIAPSLLGAFDPIKALEIEIKVTQRKAQEIDGVIAKALSDPKTSKLALDALDICKSEYGDILDTINEAVKLVAQQNVVDAYYKFSSVISCKNACEDAFKESPGVNIPFPTESQALFQLGGNCLAIMDGIVNNHRL